MLGCITPSLTVLGYLQCVRVCVCRYDSPRAGRRGGQRGAVLELVKERGTDVRCVEEKWEVFEDEE